MTIVYSHPGKNLVNHLEEVALSCKNIIQERAWLANSPVSKEIIQDIGYICGAFHDLGKSTIFFQHYLLSENHEKIGPKNHALISSIFVREIVKLFLKNSSIDSFTKNLLINFAFTTVRRHHGKLKDIEDEASLEEKKEELSKIADSIYIDETQSIIDYFLSKLKLEYNINTFIDFIKSENYVKEIYDFYDDEIRCGDYQQDITLSQKIQFFYIHQILYSSLLFSDKSDVILDTKENIQNTSPKDIVENFRIRMGFHKPNSKLAEYKNMAYENSLAELGKVYRANQHIYSITLPTGLGKTLLSFAVALKFKELNTDLKRLVIAIPFTSIIDQNFDVYLDIVQTNDSNIILKHHHQADPVYKLNDEDLEPNVSQFLIETWQSEIIVTTFVQLLNSIFSNDKGKLMKLPNLANSVVILDEIQTISYEHWALINRVFQELGKLLNCYFILMSATQPLIFNPKNEIVEIIPDYKSYFKLFDRTRLINRSATPIRFSNFIDDVFDYIIENPKKDILLIHNTKAISIRVFEALKQTIDTEEVDIYYMSTSITPFERKHIIKILKSKNLGKQRIVVTTQLIEAGVDISVDTVFRELAPIDAIIQAAGRANRYNEKNEISEVFIYEIEESRKGTSKVYGTDLILKSKNVLNQIDTISENNYLKLIEAYFEEVKIHSENRINSNLTYIEELKFESLGQFSLIEDRFTESVFVQLNQDALQVWNQFSQIYKNPDLNIFQKRLEFAKIKSFFYDFVVNVPVPFGSIEIAFDSPKDLGFRLVRLGIQSDFYSYSENDYLQNIGYKTTETIFT